MSPGQLPTPETHYARSGNVSIAYQVMGAGPLDLIMVPGLVSHIEFFHELVGYTDFVRRLAVFARVISFDKRGQGLSDRVTGTPTLDERMDDLDAVMKATGSSRAALFGYSEGASMSALFSATYPERVSHLILYGGMARFTNCEDYHHMYPLEQMLRSVPYWGSGASIKAFAPSLAGNAEATKLWAKGERLIVSPSGYQGMLETNARIDVRAILPLLRVPTVVMHNEADLAVPVANGRYLSANIPGARYIEYPAGDHRPWAEGNFEALCGDIEEFVTGRREAIVEDIERVLATVLFTDIVDSTRRLASLGDKAWRHLLDEHDKLAHRLVGQHRGRLIKTTGDGILASFDGPGRAIKCAVALSDAAARLGLSLRSGLHTGEVEARGEDIAGIAVNAAARIMSEASPGETLVSRIVTDLVAGSGVTFARREPRELKGLPGVWDLYAAA
ncbi:adenylate/guanylate cyclase domain-containing protein [Reyranella sp.]|uniref:adenylate/guanylate cyclase domain-containing protein n=1 Tax=Reyranella sp. TaxID=1929291 RepID=UPI00272FF190|nr:adenylate/guanylate cyclase domain-containing protein [Reyranella sp.]MDP2373590.1 adenylate/guanylate cyclase domain-containing protein [Reyranella sp.]